ncbi:MAG: hypothetical protein AB7O48_14055 [Cyclobacteriaceae bacterium]
MTDLNHFYSQRKNDFLREGEALAIVIRKISISRIVVALAIGVAGYFGFSNTLVWLGLIPLVVLFLFLVAKHGREKNKLDLNKNLVKLNDLELRAIHHQYREFGNGERFADPHHAYSYDLDLFGVGSVYQYINRCGTAIGEDQLANDLNTPQPSAQKISKRQNAIKELAEKVDFRQWYWAQGHLLHDNTHDNDKLFDWLKDADVVNRKRKVELALIIFPIISAALIALTIYDFAFFPLILLFGGVQWFVVSLFSKEVTKADITLAKHRKLFEKYATLLSGISSQPFHGDHLKAIQNESILASQRIRKFSSLVNALESRKNGIASMFGNSLYLYDLQCLIKLERWRVENKSYVESWLSKVAEIDALNSFATFSFNNPSNCFPTIHYSLAVEGVEMGHPLISSPERVTNSCRLGLSEHVMLVTGANMAGKSTFLRTMGVNVVLALSGSSVSASSFSCPLLQLVTSMRATDSLVDHQSYFYAELSRIKKIMDQVESGSPSLVLLDEILRGTNSRDKQDGSIGLIKQFVAHKSLVILASHDVVLGELQREFPDAIRNFCFESDIENDALKFDYSLKEGVAQRANATFLMKKMGILPAD